MPHVRDTRECATYVRVREPLPGAGDDAPDCVLLYAALPAQPHRASAALAVLRQDCPRTRVYLVARGGGVLVADEATAESALALASAPFDKQDRVLSLDGVREFIDARDGETVRVLVMADIEPAFEGGGDDPPRVHVVTGLPTGTMPHTYYAHKYDLTWDAAIAEALGALRHERRVEVACGAARRTVWLSGGATRWLRFADDADGEVTVDGEPDALEDEGDDGAEVHDGRVAAALRASCEDISPMCGMSAMSGLPDVTKVHHAQRRQRMQWLVRGVQQAVLTRGVQYFTTVGDDYVNLAHDELAQRTRRVTQQYNVSLIRDRSSQVLAAIEFFTGGGKRKKQSDGGGGGGGSLAKRLKPDPQGAP